MTPAIDAFATGDRLVPSLDPGSRPPREEAERQAGRRGACSGGRSRSTRSRSPPTRTAGSTRPARPSAGSAIRTMDYTEDLGPHVRAIMLDTVNRDGTSQARITPAQIEWLRAQLERGRRPLDRRLLAQPARPTRRSPRSTQSPASSPRSPATRTRTGSRSTAAIWRISTSSLADFPQQARMFRLRETSTGVALETWMVDHDGKGLAGISRELAYLDAQGGRPQHFAGTRQDRNVRLYVSP